MPRQSLLLSASLALAAALLNACSGGGTVPAGAQTAPKRPAATTPLQAAVTNVIVVILENRSFDNMFQFYDHSKANIASITGTATCNSGTPAAPNMVPTTLQPQTLAASTTDTGHSHINFLNDYDNGKNDGWPAFACAYVPKEEVQPDLDIANQFAISDNFFHGITAPTFPSHVEIAGASTYGVIDNPSDEVWGCDAKPGTTTGLFDPAAKDGSEEDPTAGPFPCFDELSIYDLLDRGRPAPVSWKFYDEPQGYSATGNENMPGFYRQIRYGPDWTNDEVDSDLLFADAVPPAPAPCLAPQVSFIIPNETSTDHAGTPSLGPMYLETLVNEFGESSCFANSLMIITWDDWGGWYDHVVPPKRANGTQLGFRKPIIFVGGHVKRGYVSHVQTEDASIAKTIEAVYNLGTLGVDDVAAADFSDVIDATSPVKAFVPITSMETPSVPLPVNPPPLPLESQPGNKANARFRVVPANFMRRDEHGNFASGSDDYYGRRSADY